MDYTETKTKSKAHLPTRFIFLVCVMGLLSFPFISGFDTYNLKPIINKQKPENRPLWNPACEISMSGENHSVEKYMKYHPVAVPPENYDQESLTAPLVEYHAQSGDTISAVARHFDVNPNEIQSSEPINHEGFLQPGQLLLIPDRVQTRCCPDDLLADSELVYSKTAVDFEMENFISKANGYLSSYEENLPQGKEDAAGIIYRVAINQSINPRLLIALLEYQSDWVYGKPIEQYQEEYPIGWAEPGKEGLYQQLRWTAGQLNCGYYGWREGALTEITFLDGSKLRLSPELNAGTVALQFFFAQLLPREQWNETLYGEENNFLALYDTMFENSWKRAEQIEPLISDGLLQPPMELPFESGTYWNYTGGPHAAYGPYDAIAALDFAPIGRHSCSESYEWITASASGLVVRSDDNSIVVIDLDEDGYEQTGWVLFYVHVASLDRVPVGTYVKTNDKIGHPSCEGGYSSGAHIHIARKYNGEWMTADGASPFVLSGWRAVAGERVYKGYLIKGEKIVEASDVGSSVSLITY